jgi:hypothetical protein
MSEKPYITYSSYAPSSGMNAYGTNLKPEYREQIKRTYEPHLKTYIPPKQPSRKSFIGPSRQSSRNMMSLSNKEDLEDLYKEETLGGRHRRTRRRRTRRHRKN